MLQATYAIGRRLKTGLSTWPDRRSWRLTAVVFGIYALVVGSFGFGTALYRFEPLIDSSLLRVIVIAFFVPAIGEEVFFRGVLVPTQLKTAYAIPQIVLALAVFLAWHPFNAWLFFPEVLPLFSDWRFLAVTACLGLACSYLWRATRSLWPPIIVHWLAVVIWKGFLGAPKMM